MAIFYQTPSDSERATLALNQRLRIETSTPERAAESFFTALEKRDYPWGLAISRGPERDNLLKKAGALRPKFAINRQDPGAPDMPPGETPRLLFRESRELGDGIIMLKGKVSRDPKEGGKDAVVTFVLEKSGRRWYVKRMESETVNFSE